jgi:hypothetical protein
MKVGESRSSRIFPVFPQHGFESSGPCAVIRHRCVISLREEVDGKVDPGGERQNRHELRVGCFQHDAWTGAQIVAAGDVDGDFGRQSGRSVGHDPLGEAGGESVFDELGHGPAMTVNPPASTML